LAGASGFSPVQPATRWPSDCTRWRVPLVRCDGRGRRWRLGGAHRTPTTLGEPAHRYRRNGGPTAYRPDLAHRATKRRARRRRQAAPQGPEAPPQPHGRDAEAVREYEETLTTVMMASGLPKMMARVLVCLYTTDAGSLTASELAQRLQVSPATVSKAITFLESQDLVRRERDERRRDRYVVDDDLWYQSMVASVQANAQVIETARQGVAILGPGTPAAVRLENAARFLDFVGESLTRAAEQAREILYTKPETTSDGTAKPSSDRG
jgi:DNA-binding transcriptional regulator YhcF (GntR family)